MDVKKQDMTGETMDGMMDGMMSGFADGHTPQSLLAMLIEGEQMESALYTQIAQAVPSMELGRLIMHRAMHERQQARMLAMLCPYFGVTPPFDPPMPFSVGESQEKK